MRRRSNGTQTNSLLSLDYSGEVYSLDIAPNGESIAVGGTQPLDSPAGKSAEVQVWSTPGFLKPLRLPGHSILVFSLAYDPTGRLLASCGDDKTAPLKVWDLQFGREAFPTEAFEGNQVLFSASFSKDGKWLAAAGRDRKINIWEGATGRKVGMVGGHVDEITKLTFSPDGKYLASIGNDGVVNLWDATRLDKAQEPLRGFAGQCEDFADSIAFTPALDWPLSAATTRSRSMMSIATIKPFCRSAAVIDRSRLPSVPTVVGSLQVARILPSKSGICTPKRC